jgi:hypothetical protein
MRHCAWLESDSNRKEIVKEGIWEHQERRKKNRKIKYNKL